MLVPHDSVDPSYFEITTPEMVAFLIFPTEQRAVCLEGFAFETRTFTGVTHFAVALDFAFTYDYRPGVYGMLGSVVSMVDSTTLSMYDRSVSSAIFITKEDQCVSEQTIHTTPETVYVLIFGEVSTETAVYSCATKYTPPKSCIYVDTWIED